MRRSPRLAVVGLIGVFALSGCGGALAAPPSPSSSSSRDVQVTATYSSTGGTAITYDQELVPAGARVAVSSSLSNGTTTVKLALRSVEPGRMYGAHAHSQPCGATGEDAGPHFQLNLDPVQPSVDPAYANPENEIWLDLQTDSTGAGTAETAVAWDFPADRRARSVVVHEMPTATDTGRAGTAGGRAACVSVDF